MRERAFPQLDAKFCFSDDLPVGLCANGDVLWLGFLRVLFCCWRRQIHFHAGGGSLLCRHGEFPRAAFHGPCRRQYGSVTPTDGITLVWLEDMISHNLDLLFPGMTIMDFSPFRVTRNADIDFEHEQDDPEGDISQLIESQVRERRKGAVVRLAVPDQIGQRTLSRLISHLGVDSKRDVYPVNGALGG